MRVLEGKSVFSESQLEDFYFAESRQACKAYEGRKSGGRDRTCAGSKKSS